MMVVMILPLPHFRLLLSLPSILLLAILPIPTLLPSAPILLLNLSLYFSLFPHSHLSVLSLSHSLTTLSHDDPKWPNVVK